MDLTRSLFLNKVTHPYFEVLSDFGGLV